MEEKKGKRKRDTYLRLRFVWEFLRPVAFLLTKIKLNYHFTKFSDPGEPYIVLSNHVTDWDPIMVSQGCPEQSYIVASEHITRIKLYPLVRWAFEPIIRFKGTVGAGTVMDILRKIKKGRNIILFPEGVRSMDGMTMPILPSTGKLIKRSGAALVTYRLQGGYFSSPNWSENGIRKGRIDGGAVRVLSSEQLKSMSVDEINRVIKEDLYEDATATQQVKQIRFKGKALAENLENILFVCPSCGAKESFSSKGNLVTCSACGLKAEFNAMGQLSGPFSSVRDWVAWQKQEVEQLALQKISLTSAGKVFKIEDSQLTCIAEGTVTLNGEKLCVGDITYLLKEVSDLEIQGRHVLVFSDGAGYYEIEIAKPHSAVMLLWFYNHYKQGNAKE